MTAKEIREQCDNVRTDYERVLQQENTNLKMQIEELLEKYKNMYRNTDKVAEANFEMLHGTRANYKSILGLNKEIIDDLSKLKEAKK